MAKVPFELIAPHANQFFDNMAKAPTLEMIEYWHDAYLDLLKKSGWSQYDFEREEMQRIDEEWEGIKPSKLN